MSSMALNFVSLATGVVPAFCGVSSSSIDLAQPLKRRGTVRTQIDSAEVGHGSSPIHVIMLRLTGGKAVSKVLWLSTLELCGG